MKINVQGSEHIKVPFIHASIYNDHKQKSIFMNRMIWSFDCILCCDIFICMCVYRTTPYGYTGGKVRYEIRVIFHN